MNMEYKWLLLVLLLNGSFCRASESCVEQAPTELAEVESVDESKKEDTFFRLFEAALIGTTMAFIYILFDVWRDQVPPSIDPFELVDDFIRESEGQAAG